MSRYRGWRAWWVAPEGLLRGPYAPDYEPWPGLELEARCAVGGQHAAPHLLCTCGVRALPLVDLIDYLATAAMSAPMRVDGSVISYAVVGQVELTGTIHGPDRHDDPPTIRRGSHARIIGPLFLGPAHVEQVADLRARYRPVEVVASPVRSVAFEDTYSWLRTLRARGVRDLSDVQNRAASMNLSSASLAWSTRGSA